MAGNTGTPPGGRKGIPLEDAKRQRAQQIGGTPMTEVGRARVEMLGKARDFQERAAALGLTPHQYMQQMDAGKLPTTELPAEFRDFLTKNPGANLVDPNSLVRAEAPAATAPSPASMPVAEAQPDMSVARFTPEQLAALGLAGDPNADVRMITPDAGYASTAEAIRMRQLTQGKKVGGPSDIPLPSGAPPAKLPPQAVPELGIESPIWGTGRTLLLFEQLVACLVELGMTDKLTAFQAAVDRNGLSYLEEVLARMQWRVTYVKNRQRLGRNDAQISAGLNAYERVLRPITEFIHGDVPALDERPLFLSDEEIDAGVAAAEGGQGGASE